ncbi:AraC family ligand binding domain-containing protein [Candidatus Roizmanbacteria bacterium]|nr:AraC family ligand binding domain-containing protein [Candidatus Roizmanbacteria bacterium]
MFSQGVYKNLSEEEIAKKLQEEGFDPIRFENNPGYIYPRHKHPETKLLAFLKGSMEVKVGGETYYCEAGDKLIVPGDTLHSAVVGPHGCEFFWSEKML